jgi:hypothetical protein
MKIDRIRDGKLLGSGSGILDKTSWIRNTALNNGHAENRHEREPAMRYLTSGFSLNNSP